MKVFFTGILIMAGINYLFAQCANNEVEVKVVINTDGWGYETYWTLSNFLGGNILMQGGQGGAYANYSTYTDSICLAANSCQFFEIYDDFGDGIYAPYGYELYIDDSLVAIGNNDIESYALKTINCPNPCNLVTDALNDLQGHINGSAPLSNVELSSVEDILLFFPECLADSETNIVLANAVVSDYDNTFGALFTTASTQNGFSKDPTQATGFELERVMIALEQGMFDYIFTAEVYENYPQHINGTLFNSCSNFPGYIAPPADSSIVNTAMIRANFADPDGSNPYFNINGDGTDHALRPTGLYLAPGSVASITVPDSLVGQDYYVRVGFHEWDVSIRPVYRRLDRISKKFAIDSTTVEVFNPFGGSIAILVPYGADDGILQVSVSNAHQAPFFSMKSFYETPDFSAELNKPGIWAVFETDNVMFSIPKHSIVPGQYDLRQSLLDWDAAIQGVNSVISREIVPDKHDMYMIADITIRYNAYSIGYPMSNSPLNYTSVPGPAYFIDGPSPDDAVNFHEHGHALAISKFPGEEEALVNVPYIMALNHGLGEDLNEAVRYSFVPNTFDIDKSATHRMLSNTFGVERNISNTTTDEVRYQHRGYAHYFEIVNLFGWCPLRNFWKQEYTDFENGINHGINNQDIDSRILRMSIASNADLRPLFHVYGILPQDSIALEDSLIQNNIPESQAIYDRLSDYFSLIPVDSAAFNNYALSVYPNLYTDGPTANPDYGVGWHYQKSLTYNSTEAQQRITTLQDILNYYYPNARPVSGADPSELCCSMDSISISILNNDSLDIQGGVPPYEIVYDTINNVPYITVIDFDSCQSTLEGIISSLSNSSFDDEITIYPNPSEGTIQINFGDLKENIHIQTLDLRGRLIKSQVYPVESVLNYQLPDHTAIYILKIIYQDGRYRSFKVVRK